jgi:hypothetical protein
MKKLIFIILSLISGLAYGQQDIQTAKPVGGNPSDLSTYNKQTVVTPNNRFKLTLYIPTGGSPTLNNGKDSSGAVYQAISDSSFNIRLNGSWIKYKSYTNALNALNTKANKTTTITINGVAHDLSTNRSWTVASAGRDTFVSNFKLNGVPNGLELWNNGDSVPAKGLTAKELILLGSQQVIHPTYYQPSNNAITNPGSGQYEIGTIFSGAQIALTHGFTQNDAGAETGTTYLKNGSPITSPDNFTLLTQVYYQAVTSYAQGACKLNNLGQVDCVGRVVAGTITSGALYVTPVWKRYWGLCVGTAPTQSEVLAALSGGMDIQTNHSFGFTIADCAGKHVFMAALASYGHITSLVQNGFPSLGAYTETNPDITNAQGHIDSYYIQTSNNAFTGSSGAITTN